MPAASRTPTLAPPPPPPPPPPRTSPPAPAPAPPPPPPNRPPRSRPAEGGPEVALTRSQRTGAKAGAISPESFLRSRDIWPKAIRHVALSGRVKTCARFKSFPDRVQGTQKRNEQKRK